MISDQGLLKQLESSVEHYRIFSVLSVVSCIGNFASGR